MARIIVLDSGPLGLACDNPNKPRVKSFGVWWVNHLTSGSIVVIPEIADYEVRRELIRVRRRPGLERLDEFHREMDYVPLSTAAMRRAAELWAEVRSSGLQTADDKALDADVIVAAQALTFAGGRDQVTVATDNVTHLSRFVDARNWELITP